MAGGPAPYMKRNTAERAQRAELIFDLRARGMSYGAIDDLTQHPDGPTGGRRISAGVAKELVREEGARRVDPKIDTYRAIELERLEASLERLNNMEASVQRVMARKHITVNNGKVIRLEDPETGEDEPVEDDTFILQAVDRLNRIEESRRKLSESIRRLLGLDAPARIETTVTETTQQDIELQELVAEMRAKNANVAEGLRGEREPDE